MSQAATYALIPHNCTSRMFAKYQLVNGKCRLSVCISTQTRRLSGQSQTHARSLADRTSALRASTSYEGHCWQRQHDEPLDYRIERRPVLLGLLSGALLHSAGSAEGDVDGLVEYRSSKNQYRLQRPAGWEVTSKPGADVLFQDPAQKSTSVGITVSPIRINSLDQFGDVTSVGEKLLATERGKESTLEAQLLHEGTRVGASGTLIYDFDYSINTTRGAKRVLSTVAIADRKLYIVNGTVKCAVGQCASDADQVVQILAKVTGSFDIDK